MSVVQAGAPELRPPAHRLDRRVVRYWTLRAGGGWLLLLVAQSVWLLLAHDGRRGAHLVALLVTAVVGVAHTCVMPSWRYRVHRWEATPDALFTQTGWLVEDRRIAPVSRIQTVDTTRGPLEQVLGLTNVTVTTASAAGPLIIQGLDHTTASELVAELTRLAQDTEDDAT
ncbi:PH domain-containing protein [Streptomyces rishiriensis]|uniref:PH domain-containing protein n=1 Tax=Streptomyces rishiriensis TaxID=68264 RepID=UPI0037CFF18C